MKKLFICLLLALTMIGTDAALGLVGMGSNAYATSSNSSSSRGRAIGLKVVYYAKTALGTPYVFAGSNIYRGVDCSGLVSGVYKKVGKNLPHSSWRLRGVGRRVSYSDALPGDIICYNGHVAIYTGNGRIIHADSVSGRVERHRAGYTRIVMVRRVWN